MSCGRNRPGRSASPPRSTPATTVLWPALERFLPHDPDIHVELSIDSSLTDIVTERFDAGVRLGEALAKDMVAVRICAWWWSGHPAISPRAPFPRPA
ncbi:Transcriptional regulator [Bosea sp. LC85]|nr:Transcriptional regulator [Bosea sp. LC85]